MAFGISREELNEWKQSVSRGEIAFITHYWHDPRFPGIRTVTKVGCSDRQRLTDWCVANGLNPVYIHDRPPFPHFDLMGPKQKEILEKENQWEQVTRFRL
ncbi:MULTISPECIES: hypothetical protein [Brevibacillus]|jgi:hypothetical protein|uniref:YneQ n=1 Tax=Brevibacillus borstelensis AK1 TaxID=1300222 RepID=M8DAQ4_9BACL|nr:hypothetical protein [Brevibacillus borstelensis]EMT53369.1 hypothetical protein I532_05135 [Brevibacillus borstelensis AK1]KKX53231.1 hypothetical protein X546_22100 [Brevibacillus borstelensis cifa_chp40]MBE5394227.1 hypothetical protein [Brevibacillus borstelensis]MCC0564259.1 hypothetical protein [Brevibacillus borstelensis]MCM3471574.1 hypothetical protein [Brevibacillus borstelensis]